MYRGFERTAIQAVSEQKCDSFLSEYKLLYVSNTFL